MNRNAPVHSFYHQSGPGSWGNIYRFITRSLLFY